MLAALVAADKDELLPLLKTGGDCENDCWTVKITPPEARIEGKSFIDYRKKAA